MSPGIIMEEPSSSSGEAPKPASRGKALWIVIAVLVVIVVVVLAAAVGGLFSPSGKAPLRIGTLLSLTGGLALFGPGDTKGANLAVEVINAGGGGHGYQQPLRRRHRGDLQAEVRSPWRRSCRQPNGRDSGEAGGLLGCSDPALRLESAGCVLRRVPGHRSHRDEAVGATTRFSRRSLGQAVGVLGGPSGPSLRRPAP